MNSKVLFSAVYLLAAVPSSAQTDAPWFLSASDSLCGVRLTEICAARGKIPPPSRKKSEIIVAVIDGGFDVSHTALADFIWTNPREQAANGRDDDKNGYVDDIHGWNFIIGISKIPL